MALRVGSCFHSVATGILATSPGCVIFIAIKFFGVVGLAGHTRSPPDLRTVRLHDKETAGLDKDTLGFLASFGIL